MACRLCRGGLLSPALLARTASTAAPLSLSLRPSPSGASSSTTGPATQHRFKSSKANKSSGAAKGSFRKEVANEKHNTQNEDIFEELEAEELKPTFDDLVERLRVKIKPVADRVGPLKPSLTDSVRVLLPEGRVPLKQLANVSVKDGKQLLVEVFDPEHLKPTLTALQSGPLSMSPTPLSETVIRLSPSRPDWAKRQEWARDSSRVCEDVRVEIRAVRSEAGRRLKKEEKDGRPKGDVAKQVKKVDALAKKATDEVDVIHEQVKKLLMDESTM